MARTRNKEINHKTLAGFNNGSFNFNLIKIHQKSQSCISQRRTIIRCLKNMCNLVVYEMRCEIIKMFESQTEITS